MPCFKGLAVSIHTPDGPLSEHSIQKQARNGRITSYIPVPPAKIPPASRTGIPEQSTFAVSITLLTPGLTVPYSAPKPTPEDPYPQGRTVGGLPGTLAGERGRYGPVVTPYFPRTTSPNETLAAYIYFDGRPKEEVATLLRRGEETWVNSRWVSVADSEGGGLAEREFLFREVGLERWLNGLDLEGKDKAARIEKRQQRIEKKRRQKKEEICSDDEEEKKPRFDRNGVLRYAKDGASATGNVVNDTLLSSDSDSEDEPPEAEAAGQIKVALFRVLASGEIKRGEYSPQFNAHDDDEANEQGGGGGDGLDHTTSFAKPKTLDPKSISTQTVTGLDPPDAPYAVFTFLYRGEKQLQKMGILPMPDSAHHTPTTAKRKSFATDFSSLGPLQSFGTVGFTGYRDTTTPKNKKPSKVDKDAMDSDNDEEDEGGAMIEEGDVKDENGKYLSPEDVRKQGELADGVRKIKLKRVHSAERIETRKSPYLNPSESPTAGSGTPQSGNSLTANAGTPPEKVPAPPNLLGDGDGIIGSPFKKQRASMTGDGSGMFAALDAAANIQSVADTSAVDMAGVASSMPAATGVAETVAAPSAAPPLPPAAAVAVAATGGDTKVDSDEEL